MKLIIAGSRDMTVSEQLLLGLIGNLPIDVSEIVSGGANGIDACGEKLTKRTYASDYISKVLEGKCKVFPADWDKNGKAAGPIRNKEMADYADALLLIWDGQSSGSLNMKENMLKLNKPVYEIILREHNVKK